MDGQTLIFMYLEEKKILSIPTEHSLVCIMVPKIIFVVNLHIIPCTNHASMANEKCIMGTYILFSCYR